MRVLHVTESSGGGVMTSVLAMVEATPEADHHFVFWPVRDHSSTGDSWRSASSRTHLPRNPARAVLGLRRTVRDLFPDVVHAHSSYAGMLVRAAGLEGTRVVYSPHCFGFERRDTGALLDRAMWQVERSLVTRTDLVVAVSPHEVRRARDLGHAAVAHVPNRPLVPIAPVATHRADAWRIVTVGRVTAQKDWRYHLHLKRYAEEVLGLDATWEWLGGGDATGEAALTDAGVEVSGWLPRSELLERLGMAQAYVHTAAWEGAPVSVLEAAALGLPLAVRAIGPTTSTRAPGTSARVPDLADRLVALRNPTTWLAAREESLVWARAHSSLVQGDLLLAAYRSLLPCAPSVQTEPARQPGPVAVPPATSKPAAAGDVLVTRAAS